MIKQEFKTLNNNISQLKELNKASLVLKDRVTHDCFQVIIALDTCWLNSNIRLKPTWAISIVEIWFSSLMVFLKQTCVLDLSSSIIFILFQSMVSISTRR